MNAPCGCRDPELEDDPTDKRNRPEETAAENQSDDPWEYSGARLQALQFPLGGFGEFETHFNKHMITVQYFHSYNMALLLLRNWKCVVAGRWYLARVDDSEPISRPRVHTVAQVTG